MYKIIFRMTDGSKNIIQTSDVEFVWMNIETISDVFETETNHVKSIMSIKM